MQSRHSGRGFTMVEVLVALIVTSVGLLGIAKMQALAYSSTGSSSVRSLAAIEASSLASAMRANRAYWSMGLAPARIIITRTQIDDATLNGAATAATYCQSGGAGAPCSAATLAAYDLHTWANALNGVLLNPVTTIACPNPGTGPMNCTIQIAWNEKTVAVNKEGVNPNSSAMAAPYTLYVEP